MPTKCSVISEHCCVITQLNQNYSVIMSYCVYDTNVPGSEKTKVAKNGQKYVISVCAVCGKKKSVFLPKK